MFKESGIEISQVADLDNCSSLLLITANVGSLFEDPIQLLKPWLNEFLQNVCQFKPLFLALHLQEVGGKTYEKSMEYVQEFIKCLCEATEMHDFSVIRVFMDEDYNSPEHFTALGNLYFAHKHLTGLRIWNFLSHDWELAENKNIFSGNIETIPTKEKSKFPQHFFPECKWSRKGFMRTRWEINHTVIDFVNIHLFHDASNLAACEQFPSVYCKTRRRALLHTLERFHLDDKNGFAPYFLFGDFNFRCDTEGVVKELTENLTVHRIQSIKNDGAKIHFRNSTGDNVLTIGKKEFNHANHQLKFKEEWLKKFDRELEALGEVLLEYSINFPPSYPYEEDPEMPSEYMSTRCPSWCDRILMSPQVKELILEGDTNSSYGIIGENTCMGDHKPIYLNIRLKPNQGTYRCCKCYLNLANSNKSTSQFNPALDLATIDVNVNHCPYESKIYREISHECQRINREIFNSSKDQNLIVAESVTTIPVGLPPQHLKSSQACDQKCLKTKYPQVSINIIDSDNLYVCMCSQVPNDEQGSICPECQKIIKKQPLQNRYQLISKCLMLSNNVIINRIDTQYLNTHIDVTNQRQDPYTPESAESYSPCPELNSSGTTLSASHYCSKRESINKQQVARVSSGNSRCNETVKKNNVFHEQQRGTVSPGQLKLRLEDLQRSSINKIILNDSNNFESNNGAGNSDVENVDDFCHSIDVRKKHENSCFPKCCNIH